MILSWKSHLPRREAATPRTAEETMCVMGEVTLIESRLAMLMRKPRTPCATTVQIRHCEKVGWSGRTVIADPHMNVVNGSTDPSCITLGASTRL